MEVTARRAAVGDDGSSVPIPSRGAAFSLDAEQPDYDLDTDDEAFVTKLRKKMEILPLQFEEMIDRLEKGSGQQVTGLMPPPTHPPQPDNHLFTAQKCQSLRPVGLQPA